MSTQEFYKAFCILLKANSNLDVLDQASYYISCRTKAWFPYDRLDHPDRQSRFETIGSFDMIVSIASKARDAGSSAMSLGETIEFYHVFRKQAKHDNFHSESGPRALLSSFSLDFAASRS